jgi:septation ring formation regulator EzrA
MKLEKNERIKVQSLIVRFHETWNEIENLEKNLTKISKLKEMLLKQLKDIRKDETKIVDELKEKYGEQYSLDLETYELKETPKACLKKSGNG